MAENLEKNFLERLKINNLILSIGSRMTGKTLFVMSCLLHLLQNNYYDQYHLVLTTLHNQADNTFEFLFRLPQNMQQKITIYEDFTLDIIENLLRDKKNKKFLFCDDATPISEFQSNNEIIASISTMGRHNKLTTWLVFHYLKRTVSPLLRSSAEFIFLHRTGNAKLIEDIGTELFSMFLTPKEFMTVIRNELKSRDFPNVCLWVDKGKFDISPNDWSFIVKNRKHILSVMNIDKQNKPNDSKKDSLKSQRGARIEEHSNQQSKVQENKNFKVVNEKSKRRGTTEPNFAVLFGKV